MIIDGKRIAAALCDEIGRKISHFEGRKPHLAFLIMGDNPASQIYVGAKQKACFRTGIASSLHAFHASDSQEALLAKIEELNQNPKIDGILVQLPLPPQIDEWTIMYAIDPAKDVDGFHPLNVGKMLLGIDGGFLPCTPHGIAVLLERSKIPVEGKHVVIIGRSNIVGKPLAAILMQKRKHCNATVTILHSHSEHLTEIAASADILVAAIGKPHFVTQKMVRPGAAVIDVGISRIDGKIRGDIDFDTVSKIASHITPVPGGVGPMTIAMLLENTLLSYMRREGLC